MKAALIIGVLAAAGLDTGAFAASPAAAAPGGVAYLRGALNPEDIVAVADGGHLIVSGFVGPGMTAGKLYLIDAAKRTLSDLVLRTNSQPLPEYSACPGRLEPGRFRPHGIALGRTAGGRPLLYVVNHGGRESIEMFTLDKASGGISLTWAGCVPLPDGASGNGVAGLADGGFVATRFFDTRRGDWIAQLTALEKTGTVYVWRPKTGFAELAGAQGSGDNGIEVSPDGRWAYVNLWPEKRILRLALDGGSPASSIPIDFMPDNIHLAPDGSLLVGGHIADIRTLMACKRKECPVDWAVARLDPQSLKVEYLLWEKGTPAFEGITGAAQSGRELWLSTFRGDRLGIVSLPTPPLK